MYTIVQLGPSLFCQDRRQKKKVGQIDEMDKELGGLEFVFWYKDKKVTKSKPIAANP